MLTFTSPPVSRNLYFMFSPWCSHCHEAMKHLTEYQRRHGYRIPIIRLNLSLRDWTIDGWSPDKTPAYALLEGGKLVRRHEGLMNLSELEEFLR